MTINKNISHTPAVSWLLCTHVVNDFLRIAIQSCLDQTFTDFELIIVANGNDANKIAQYVKELFGGDGRLRIFTTEIKHLVFSLNLGLHHAKAPLIARMDGDDISSPDRLKLQVSFMRKNPDVVVLGSSYETINANGKFLKKIELPVSDLVIRRALFYGNPICHPSVMFRRSIVLSSGGYIGGLHAEDYDLWSFLAINKNYKFANLPDICLFYRNIGVGPARGSRMAYASVAAAQFRNFVYGDSIFWCFFAFISFIKALMRSSKKNFFKSES